MEKISQHWIWEWREEKKCDFKTKEELRQLYAETLWNKELTWDEIHQQTDENLWINELPDTQCFFDLENWNNQCYSVPKIDNPNTCEKQ